jgi:hypothetical protein
MNTPFCWSIKAPFRLKIRPEFHMQIFPTRGSFEEGWYVARRGKLTHPFQKSFFVYIPWRADGFRYFIPHYAIEEITDEHGEHIWPSP